MPERLVVLVSGGLHSGILYRNECDAGRDPLPLHLDLGQRSFAGEAETIRALNIPALTVSLSAFGVHEGPHPDCYIPARNVLMGVVGVQYGDRLLHAAPGPKEARDNGPSFCANLSALLSHATGHPILFEQPVYTIPSHQLVRAFLLRRPDLKDWLLMTRGCHEQHDDCPKRRERQAILSLAGVL